MLDENFYFSLGVVVGALLCWAIGFVDKASALWIRKNDIKLKQLEVECLEKMKRHCDGLE